MSCTTNHALDSTDSVSLHNRLPGLVGQAVVFSNGCWLTLVDNGDDAFWGTGPYGLDWCCNSNGDWVAKVITWLEYWNADRDERGNTIERDSDMGNALSYPELFAEVIDLNV